MRPGWRRCGVIRTGTMIGRLNLINNYYLRFASVYFILMPPQKEFWYWVGGFLPLVSHRLQLYTIHFGLLCITSLPQWIVEITGWFLAGIIPYFDLGPSVLWPHATEDNTCITLYCFMWIVHFLVFARYWHFP